MLHISVTGLFSAHPTSHGHICPWTWQVLYICTYCFSNTYVSWWKLVCNSPSFWGGKQGNKQVCFIYNFDGFCRYVTYMAQASKIGLSETRVAKLSHFTAKAFRIRYDLEKKNVIFLQILDLTFDLNWQLSFQ